MLALGLSAIAHKYGAHPVYEDAQEYSLANKRALLLTTSEAVLEGREETSGSPQTWAFRTICEPSPWNLHLDHRSDQPDALQEKPRR